jgi:hypothetical protein
MAALPLKAFSGKVESGFPSEMPAKSLKHACPRDGAGTGPI